MRIFHVIALFLIVVRGGGGRFGKRSDFSREIFCATFPKLYAIKSISITTPLFIQLDGLCISEVVSEVVAEVEEEVEEVEGVGGTSRKALLVLPVSTSIATACKA